MQRGETRTVGSYVCTAAAVDPPTTAAAASVSRNELLSPRAPREKASHRASSLHDRPRDVVAWNRGAMSFCPAVYSLPLLARANRSDNAIFFRIVDAKQSLCRGRGRISPPVFFQYWFGRFRRILPLFPRYRRHERGPALRGTTRFINCGTPPPLSGTNLYSEKPAQNGPLNRCIQNLAGNGDNAERVQQIIDQQTTTSETTKRQRHYSPHACVRTYVLLLLLYYYCCTRTPPYISFIRAMLTAVFYSVERACYQA